MWRVPSGLSGDPGSDGLRADEASLPMTTVALRSAEVTTRGLRPLSAKAAAARGAWRSLVSISR